MTSNAAEFSDQYNSSYIARLNHMSELIMSNPALNEYGLPVKKLSDAIYDECIVIAILFVSSTAKYSILRQNDSTNVETYFNEGSQLLLEDNSGKVQVIFKNRPLGKLKVFSSGIVLGFVGCKNEKNQFECSDLIFPKPLHGLFVPSQVLSTNRDSQKILILSNVCLNKENYEKVRLLVVFYSDKVGEIVIFGDLLRSDSSTPDFEDFNSLVAGIGCTISIVPGMNDPTHRTLPQKPLARMLFNNKLEDIKFLPHPCETRILGKSFVLINDEIIRDLMKYRLPKDVFGDLADLRENTFEPIDILEQLVKIRHVAPNCPDTLSCIPFAHRDPFIICECDYLVAGGSSQFAHRTYNGIALVCVKDFQLSGSGVLMDVGTNTLTEVEFAGF